MEKMIRGASLEWYPPVVPPVLDFQGVQADCHSRMTWMIATSHVILLLMMWIHWILKRGDCFLNTFISVIIITCIQVKLILESPFLVVHCQFAYFLLAFLAA